MTTPIDAVRRTIADALRPDAQVWVDEWAEANRVLPADTPEPGPYRNVRTPYLIDIQRTMSPGSPYREGWWMKPHQIGGSVSGENMIGTWICAAAGSILVVFPTLDDGKQWELTRFEPMRVNTRALRRRIRAADTKGSDNTKLRKKYPGGVMRLVGANRVGALKSSTVRYVKFEECDEYVVDLEGQGGVIELAMARTSNFGRRAKIYGDSTPTIDGRSAIQRNVKRGDQRKWHLHCPDCGHPQFMEWRQLKWLDADPDSARYACLECGVLNGEHAWKARNYAPRAPGMTEAQAAAAGLAHWKPTAVGEPGVASWCGTPALMAPIGWRPWPMLVREWLAAQGDDEKLKFFVNTMLGECYADQVRTEIGAEQLQQRAENYALMTAPQGALVAVAGVDTQDNRLAVVIRAYGRGEESWGIFHGEIYGTPSSPETWVKLRELLEAPIRHASGQIIRVDAAAIDSGGHHTEDVYAFCRDAQLRGRHWFAIKGGKSYDTPKLGKPRTVEFTWRGKPVPGGVTLRLIGTQAIKNLLDGRLRLERPGGGYLHFPLGFEADYYRQLRSERREWRRDMQGHKALWWVAGKERNEAWDCEVYAYAALLYAISGRHADTVWRTREKVLGAVPQPDMFDPASAAAVQTSAPAAEAADDPGRTPARLAPPPRRSRRAGFITRW
jgi:phage terminase large subunit GpA-like protein